MTTEPGEEVKDDDDPRPLFYDEEGRPIYLRTEDIPFLDEDEETRLAIRATIEMIEEEPW